MLALLTTSSSVNVEIYISRLALCKFILCFKVSGHGMYRTSGFADIRPFFQHARTKFGPSWSVCTSQSISSMLAKRVGTIVGRIIEEVAKEKLVIGNGSELARFSRI